MTSTACAVLVSGGIESSILAAESAARGPAVTPVYIRQGLRWEEAELAWLIQFLRAVPSPALRPLTVIKLPLDDVYQNHWSLAGGDVPDAASPDEDVYLPGRNLILLAKTVVYCARAGIPAIALGPLKGNPFPDSTREFFDRFSALASQALKSPITIATPYQNLEKWEVIRRGAGLPLPLTFSCLSPHGLDHCGACNKCDERRRAFQKAGIADPTVYAESQIAH